MFPIYVDQAPVLMPAAAVVFVFTGVLSAVLMRASPGAGAAVVVVTVVATTLFTGMVVELVADVQDGRRDASVRSAARGGRAGALAPDPGRDRRGRRASSIGFVLLDRPRPDPADDLGGRRRRSSCSSAPACSPRSGAAASSCAETAGRSFGVILLLVLGVMIVSLIDRRAAAAAGTGAGIVARVVVGVLTAPLSALAAAVLYFELGRHRARDSPRRAGAPPSGA